jgi:3-isopropylmalate/(R)-2-methylmalate dehydratase large subunit
VHAVDKILARASGRKEVCAGEIVEAEVDVLMVHDRGFDLVLKALEELSVQRVHRPESVVFVFDHSKPPLDRASALKLKTMRCFAQKYGIGTVHDIGDGICHVLLPEKGHVWPGALMVGTDSHTTTASALGCLSPGVGKSDAAAVMATGELWFKVPEVVKFNLSGELQEMVMARDIAQYILGEFGTRVAQYRVAEYAGPAVESISMDGRFSLCNLAIEMGSKTGFIEPDSRTMEYVEERGGRTHSVVKTDPEYQYVKVHNIDISILEPRVACPHNPDNVKPVKDVEGVPIDQASIGTCTGSRLEDLRVAATIFKDRKVHPGVSVQVTPGSREIYTKAASEGLIEIFLRAGVNLGMPSCFNCGLLYRAPGETSIHTGPRNFQGRGGYEESYSYNASPATVAASAVEGRIADPRRYAT